MHPSDRYAAYSLELHLFFARIMKEHALFLAAGFTPANADFARTATHYKNEFESLLCNAVALSSGVVGCEVLNSGEIVTPFTAAAERQTERFTGIRIQQGITAREKLLRPATCSSVSPRLNRQVQHLNQTALRLLNGLIQFKERVLANVLSCRMFTMNYPLLLEHIIREAKLYREYVRCLEETGDLNLPMMERMEQFWNQIMMEHALFIRGLLDPTEDELIETADSFAQNFKALLERARESCDKTIVRKESLAETQQFQQFKEAGVQGIEKCQIRSIILPLLADHVLREANHYIRLLCE